MFFTLLRKTFSAQIQDYSEVVQNIEIQLQKAPYKKLLNRILIPKVNCDVTAQQILDFG